MNPSNPKKVLITGFKRFGSHAANPSQLLVESLDPNRFTPHLIMEKRILDVAFDAVSDFADSLDPEKYDIILMTGLNARICRPSIERVAINVEHARRKDEFGMKPLNRMIDPASPDGIFTSFPLDKLYSGAKTGGLGLRISNTAGTFVCNSLFFRVLQKVDKNKTIAGFMHLPKGCDSERLEHLMNLVHKILRTLTDHLQG